MRHKHVSEGEVGCLPCTTMTVCDLGVLPVEHLYHAGPGRENESTCTQNDKAVLLLSFATVSKIQQSACVSDGLRRHDGLDRKQQS